MRGRTKTDWWGVALDAPDGLALARFYAGLLGWPIAQQDGDEAAIAVPGTSSYLAFKTEPLYVPPDDVRVMLDPAGHPFCLYLDPDPS